MPDVENLEALLVDCTQDLREGESATQDRLPDIAAAVSSDALVRLLRRRLEASRARADDLDVIARGLGVSSRGPENLWMGAMLEDGKRDTEMVARGPLLDIALVGAVRKMVTASLVSYQTAVAVAERIGAADAAGRLGRACEAEAEADRDLHAALDRLARD